MALTIGDNFKYQANKPNFERDSFATLEAMKAYPETSIDDGHLSYCAETNKHYKFLSSNTVDETTGKWREFETGASISEDGVTGQVLTKTDNGYGWQDPQGSQEPQETRIVLDEFSERKFFDEFSKVTGAPAIGWAGALFIDDFSSSEYRDFYCCMTYGQGIVIRHTYATGTYEYLNSFIADSSTTSSSYNLTNKMNSGGWGNYYNGSELPLVYISRCSSDSSYIHTYYAYKINRSVTPFKFERVLTIKYSGSKLAAITSDITIDAEKKYLYVHGYKSGSADAITGTSIVMVFNLPEPGSSDTITLNDSDILWEFEFFVNEAAQDLCVSGGRLYYPYGSKSVHGIAVVDTKTGEILQNLDLANISTNFISNPEPEGVALSNGNLYLNYHHADTNSNEVCLVEFALQGVKESLKVPTSQSEDNVDIPNATQSTSGLMSAEDKAKLDSVSNNANNYTHPAGSAASKSLGLYKISTDSTSHVKSVSPVTKSDITSLGIPAQDTIYNNATSTASGLMSASDKEKLDSISVDNGAINVVADARALKGATMRFSGFVNGVTITQTGVNEWDGIVYDTSINKFLAKKGTLTPTYHNVWSGMDAYMSDELGTSILKDKLYICGEDVYVWSDTEGTLVKVGKEILNRVNNILYKKRVIEYDVNLTPGISVSLNDVTLGQTFPFGANSSLRSILRGIFEVTEGDKVYFSTLPSVGSYFSGCAVLDKDYIVVLSLKPSSNEIYFEVPAGGKYVVFQTSTASGYPTIYVESLEDTTEEIDTADLELLQNPTINCLQAKAAYMFGDIGTKVTQSASWRSVDTMCYSCVPGDVFYITGLIYWTYADYTSAFAVVSENDIILVKDTKPFGFWHYMTKVVVPEGGAKLLVNNSFGALRVYKKKVTRGIYPEKEPLVAAASLVTVGANYSGRRLTLSWASDTHADNNRYKRWIDWTNNHIEMFDAALHTGDFNRMADADNGFVVTALKYRTTIPFLPTLGNHDCFGYTLSTNTLNSGSLEWNGNKYIKPFVEGDSACVVGNDGCYYYRDFTDKKIRMIVINDYDKPRWADGTYWITTTDKAEIASAVEWTSNTNYAVGDVVHYKGMYVKCKTAGKLDDNAHVWRPDLAVLSKTITDCRYINQAQADFIVNAMNVSSGWGIIFVTHQPYEALPAIEHCISKWTLRRDLVNTYVGVPFGQNGYMIQDLITAYLNKTTLTKTYECITPNVDPLASNVVKTNLPDFYPDVTINADFTNAVGDVICCLNGHQHSDTAYWSQHTGDNKVLCIGAPTDCYLPFDAWSNPWPAGDIAKNGEAKDCFNAISIDTTEKAVYLVRIGADKTDQFENRDCIRISYAHNQ